MVISIRLNEIPGRFLRRAFCCLTEPIEEIIKEQRPLDSFPEQRDVFIFSRLPVEEQDSWGVLVEPSHCSTHQSQAGYAQPVWPFVSLQQGFATFCDTTLLRTKC